MSGPENYSKREKLPFFLKFTLILAIIGVLSYYIYRVQLLLKGVFGFEELCIGLLTLFICLIVIFTSLLIVLSIEEYKFHINRNFVPNVGVHHLSLNDVFENENRKKIIEKILREPGIHNNELLRECGLQKGQLQWHLYVLIQYGIIKKEKLGQYTTFFPVLKVNGTENVIYNPLAKSKRSLLILDLIEKEPGINSYAISKLLNLKRSSVKYHIDKLVKLNVIYMVKKGRELKLFTKTDEREEISE